MKNKKPKVVFTFVEAGFGHIMPAKAISDAFEEKYGNECDVVRWNIYSESSDPIIQKYCKALFGWTKDVSKNKFFYFVEKLSYKIPSKLTLKFLDFKFKKAKKKIMESIAEMSPDLMLNTYYSPSHFALECNKEGMTDTIVATYTPDPIIYSSWDRRSDLFFINNQIQFDYGVKTGFNKESLKIIPFVLRKEIANTSPDKESAKVNLGIDKDKQTIIYASGAYGAKSDKNHIKELFLSDLDVNKVIICGKNQDLYDYCNKLVAEYNLKNAYVVGFTNNMFEYLRASDLFLGKSGSNSMLEAYYFGMPTFITACANPLETEIAKYYISKMGCGKMVLSPKKMLNSVKEFFSNPKEREKYQDNISRYCDLTGAEKIADHLYNALKNKIERKKDC